MVDRSHLACSGSEVTAPRRPTERPGRRALQRVGAETGVGEDPFDDGFLTHLPTLGDEELEEIEETLTEAEREISDQRRAVYDALELILEELTRRYRDGLATVDELLQQG